ncbi:TIM barrel protein [Butyricicoccus sp.]|uniref:TIM barrel protein n=1 Tax=Butyricicoccus sp. TaxID=2049021 RepID=UPI003F188479
MSLQKCACIDTLYTELPWLERFQAAKNDGFAAVEFWDYRIRDLDATRAAAEKAGIMISGFNGDADYSLVDPTHKQPYLDYLKQSIAAAKQIGAKSVTIHSNALGEAGIVVNHYDDLSDTVKLCSMYDTLLACAKLAEQEEINLNLEALNITTDHVGNYLATTQMGAEICRLIGSPRLKILYDVYHMQLNEGSLCDTITKYADQMGHIHVADAPGRHEPGTGEINYKKVIGHLEACGYTGYVGYELFPAVDTATAVKGIMENA